MMSAPCSSTYPQPALFSQHSTHLASQDWLQIHTRQHGQASQTKSWKDSHSNNECFQRRFICCRLQPLWLKPNHAFWCCYPGYPAPLLKSAACLTPFSQHKKIRAEMSQARTAQDDGSNFHHLFYHLKKWFMWFLKRKLLATVQFSCRKMLTVVTLKREKSQLYHPQSITDSPITFQAMQIFWLTMPKYAYSTFRAILFVMQHPMTTSKNPWDGNIIAQMFLFHSIFFHYFFLCSHDNIWLMYVNRSSLTIWFGRWRQRCPHTTG